MNNSLINMNSGWWAQNPGNLVYLGPIEPPASALDWPSLLLFLAIAICYFVAPILGYAPTSRQRLALALWLLVGKLCLGLLRITLQAMQTIDGYGSNQLTNGGPLFKSLGIAQATFPAAETLFLFLALAMFVLGLQRLTRRPPEALQPGKGRELSGD